MVGVVGVGVEAGVVVALVGVLLLGVRQPATQTPNKRLTNARTVRPQQASLVINLVMNRRDDPPTAYRLPARRPWPVSLL